MVAGGFAVGLRVCFRRSACFGGFRASVALSGPPSSYIKRLFSTYPSQRHLSLLYLKQARAG